MDRCRAHDAGINSRQTYHASRTGKKTRRDSMAIVRGVPSSMHSLLTDLSFVLFHVNSRTRVIQVVRFIMLYIPAVAF